MNPQSHIGPVKIAMKESKFEIGTLVWKNDLEARFHFHPVSTLFPLLGKEAFKALVVDIKENGLLEEILLFNGKIADGRNRFNACLEAGVNPAFKEFSGTLDELEKIVYSKNLKRRHLDEDQKEALAVEFRKKGFSQEEIAEIMGAGTTSVNRWLKNQKDKFQTENTKRKDKLGRDRPTTYKKKEETAEEKEARMILEAADGLDKWLEEFKELGQETVSEIVDTWLDGPFFKVKKEEDRDV